MRIETKKHGLLALYERSKIPVEFLNNCRLLLSGVSRDLNLGHVLKSLVDAANPSSSITPGMFEVATRDSVLKYNH